jgi:hypothetical protein
MLIREFKIASENPRPARLQIFAPIKNTVRIIDNISAGNSLQSAEVDINAAQKT